jgi:hypothetical protein
MQLFVGPEGKAKGKSKKAKVKIGRSAAFIDD